MVTLPVCKLFINTIQSIPFSVIPNTTQNTQAFLCVWSCNILGKYLFWPTSFHPDMKHPLLSQIWWNISRQYNCICITYAFISTTWECNSWLAERDAAVYLPNQLDTRLSVKQGVTTANIHHRSRSKITLGFLEREVEPPTVTTSLKHAQLMKQSG